MSVTASDERPATLNRFRSTYRELTAHEKVFVSVIKDKAEELATIIDNAKLLTQADRRQLALASTNLELAVMWAVKGVTG